MCDTSTTVAKDYRLIGYMIYDARTTEIEIVNVSTEAQIYLPLVISSDH